MQFLRRALHQSVHVSDFSAIFLKSVREKVGWRKDFCDGKNDRIGKMAKNWRKMTEKRKVLFLLV